jgi:hypothetical protein
MYISLRIPWVISPSWAARKKLVSNCRWVSGDGGKRGRWSARCFLARLDDWRQATLLLPRKVAISWELAETLGRLATRLPDCAPRQRQKPAASFQPPLFEEPQAGHT